MTSRVLNEYVGMYV